MIGFDCGTYNLVCTRRGEGDEVKHRKEVNAFIEIPLDNRYLFNMMKKAGVPLIERDNVAYIIGQAAVDMAYTLKQIELKRPMCDGCLNPKEKDAYKILSIMMHSLIGKIEKDEILYYCVPANAVNRDTDADYHTKVVGSIFKSFNVDGKRIQAYPINEALALVYAELGNKQYTGIGLSCLVPGTKIYTNKGIVDIETVKEGDMVITHKGRWRKVTRVVKKHFAGLMTKLQLQGYSNNTDDYKFVDNHEVFINRDGNWQWIGCEEVKEGDLVGEPIIQQDKNAIIPAMTICNRTTCSKKTTKTRIETSSDVQRLIGYFLADGSVNMSEGCIQFDFGIQEKKYIDDVKEILLKNFKKEATSIQKTDCECIRVKCYSRGLVSYFNNHFYDEQRNKKYPWNINRLSKSMCLNLLIGLIRADGWIGEEQICFGNTSTNLILLAKQLFSRLGYAASISKRPPRTHETNGKIVSGKKYEWKLSVGTKFSAYSLKDLIENTTCNNSKHAEKLFIDNDFCCSRIQKIEKEEYEGTVYDLQVDEDHSFSGPYLTIHNCGGGMLNFCYAIYAQEVCKFSIVNSGDWIDQQAAKATGESPTYINKAKTAIDLTKPPTSLVERAIETQYRLMVENCVANIKKALVESNAIRSEVPIDIVVAGGTSAPNGFVEMLKEVVTDAKLPIDVGEIRRPDDYLYAVSRGLLVAAEVSQQ